MVNFSEAFLAVLIEGSLIFAGIAALTLIIFLIRDFSKGKIW